METLRKTGTMPNAATTKSLSAFKAAVFDLDGVVTQSAKVHAAAWKDLFDAYLRKRADHEGEPFKAFDIDRDYRDYVDGKPRYEGVRSFLESRGISLPYGTPDDSSGAETICGLGNRKNDLFHERLERDGVDVYGSSVALIRELRQNGLATALVSSSKNVSTVLAITGLADLFDVCVDGVEAARKQLKGKPNPDIFAHAAALLGVDPEQAFAVEDALAGVEAAHAAGFGLVVGVDRNGLGAALREHGADIVVSDLGELSAAGRPASLPNAAEHFDDIARRLEQRRVALFLDYDGTLTPIVSRPELAVLSREMRSTIRELAQLCPIAVVSGRDRRDVEALVGLEELVYAGSHGFDITGPNGLQKQYEEAAEFLPALDRAEAQLDAALRAVEGVLVERKRFAIAVHYRLVDSADVPAVEEAVDKAVKEGENNLRKTGGKKVFEIRPKLPWDKGRAVLWLLTALDLDHPDVLPIYLGDDETDEDAFAALRERGGLGILVAATEQATSAQYVLNDPQQVAAFLRQLIALLKRTGA